jgi:hypothetical protein
MAQFPCSNQTRGDRTLSRGFTIIEVLVAMFVLMVGLVAVGGVIGSALGNTSSSQYTNQAATLATEKLEDLNHYTSSDPHVVAVSGTPAGSLSSDILTNVTTNGVTVPINYYDEVYFSPTQGALVETGTSLDAGGNTQYQTITYTPDGQISTSAPSTTAPDTTGSIVFERRWLIERDQPVAGVRRITVVVTLLNPVRTPITFQMSMVRP